MESGSELSFENEYYHVEITVQYTGKPFKVKGNYFYITCELFEYPRQLYYTNNINQQYEPINNNYFFNDSNSIVIQNSRIEE